MDAKRKRTLDDFMAAVPEEELIAEKPSDTITLDEPKRNMWITLTIYGVAALLIAGTAYTGFRVYKSEKVISAEEKIESSIVKTETEPVDDVPVTTKTFVYVDSEGGLNLRETATVDATIVTLIPDKTKLEVEEDKDGWLKVTFEEKPGWISKELTQMP